MQHAEDILKRYYRTHPLTQAGFNAQSQKLLTRYGASSFAAPVGGQAQRSLFVDGGELVAEPVGSPRYPYGVFLELDDKRADKDIVDSVQKWLDSGAAYQQYRGMNVCRYNC